MQLGCLLHVWLAQLCIQQVQPSGRGGNTCDRCSSIRRNEVKAENKQVHASCGSARPQNPAAGLVQVGSRLFQKRFYMETIQPIAKMHSSAHGPCPSTHDRGSIASALLSVTRTRMDTSRTCTRILNWFGNQHSRHRNEVSSVWNQSTDAMLLSVNAKPTTSFITTATFFVNSNILIVVIISVMIPHEC